MQLKHFCRPLQWEILLHVMLQWRRCFRDEYDFMSRFLFPTDELATDYPGKDVPWDQGYRVVIHKNGTIVGIDDEDCYNRLTLTKADIIKYRFDLKMFRRETGGCLGLKPDIGEIDPKNRVIPWGHWEPEKGAAFPVKLLLFHFREHFKEKMFELILNRQSAGEIILTPTREDWKDGIEELARKHKLLLVPLDEILQMEDGKLQPTPEWDEYLAAFCTMVERDLPSKFQRKMPEFMLAKRGAWVFRFDTTESIVDGNLIGPPFVHFLLQHPNEEFHVEKLWQDVMGNPSAVPKTHVEAAFADDETDLPNSLLGGADDVLDAEAKKAYETRLKELSEERQEAEASKDDAELDRINGEFEMIHRALLEAGGGIHQPKKLGDPAIKLRDRIRKGIDVFIEQVAGKDSTGAKYLKNTIKKGMFVAYSPSMEIDWKFS